MLTDAQLAEIEQRWDVLWHRTEMEMTIPVELLAGAEIDVEHLLVEVRRLREKLRLRVAAYELAEIEIEELRAEAGIR